MLLAVVGGITAVAGALFGVIALAMIPLVGDAVPSIRNVMIVLPGLVGISLARNPDGAVAEIAEKVRERFDRSGKGRHSAGSTHDEKVSEPSGNGRLPTLVPELVGADGPVTAEQIRVLDHELGLAVGGCDADSGDG